jgi:hypothetical protein
MTQEQAIELCKSKWWIGREPIDLALFQMFEDRLCMPFDVFHEALEKSLGRSVFTHEIALNRDGIRKELLGERPAPSMQEVLELIPADKRVVIIW